MGFLQNSLLILLQQLNFCLCEERSAEAIQKKSFKNPKFSIIYDWLASVFDLAMTGSVEFCVVAAELKRIKRERKETA